MARKRQICSIHDDVMDEVRMFDDPRVPYQLRRKVNKIVRMVEDAKERGQAMENRLIEYRTAIEGIGFIREVTR